MKNHKRVVAIIQARMGSTRLPGKVLRSVGDATMLEQVVRRAQKARNLCAVGVATSIKPEDDQIFGLCSGRGIFCYRGPEEDVLGRYYLAAREMAADVIVRITGDCPLIDPDVIDEVVRTHVQSQNDLTFSDVENSYPRGMDVDVISFGRLEYLYKTAHRASHREHVILYMYEHADRFKIQGIQLDLRLRRTNLRLCVDEIDDLVFVRRIFEHFAPRTDFSLVEIIGFLDRYPGLLTINQRVRQKPV